MSNQYKLDDRVDQSGNDTRAMFDHYARSWVSDTRSDRSDYEWRALVARVATTYPSLARQIGLTGIARELSDAVQGYWADVESGEA